MTTKEANQENESLHIQEMYQDYFLDYASYVITDRAVPYARDGLKPVQRRLLHSLFEVNDGRFHKAANIIGNTMKYHPHGDAAIRDALVNIAQKDLMIETQGNWGDPVTGDSAAAPRYVECKLSKFALEVGFNKATTQWQKTYDGRNREPIHLPVKFPLLLAQGTEGIAVGLSTKILPHNFCELLQSCIKILKNKPFRLVPDFLTGGTIDASEYNQGKSGGKVKVRATILKGGNKSLVIKEIPYGTTTSSLMESIVTANDKGKIKIKRIEDNTAKDVEIIITLPPGTDQDKAIDALYKFTECESSISVNCCVIKEKHPAFLSVNDLLKENVNDTVDLLKLELEIRKNDLEEKLHFRTLEQIFIEERIYRKIENCETWEAIIKTIHAGLKPFSKKFIRKVTDEDVTKLTEIRIKRISKFDSNKANDEIISLQNGIKEVNKNLKNLVEYSIQYFEHILEKYGKNKKRKTKIEQFEEISASDVILSNLKVGYDKETGFIGTSVRSENFVSNCSALDDIIVFTEDGNMVVTKVADKTYVGKNIMYAEKFDKNNEDIIYNMIYREGRMGPVYIKRFAVGGVTRDKNYNLCKGKENSKVFHFSVSGKITTEKLEVRLVPKPRIKKEFKLSVNEFEIKGRNSAGNIVTKHSVKKIVPIKGFEPSAPGEGSTASAGESKSKPKKKSGDTIYWDKKNHLIGFKVKGEAAFNLDKGELIVILYDDGSYITYSGQDSLEVGDGIVYMGVWDHTQIFCALFTDGNTGHVFGKRFQIVASTDEKYYFFISDYEDSKLEFLTDSPEAELEITVGKAAKKQKQKQKQKIKMNEENFPLSKTSQMGNKISTQKISQVKVSKDTQMSLL